MPTITWIRVPAHVWARRIMGNRRSRPPKDPSRPNALVEVWARWTTGNRQSPPPKVPSRPNQTHHVQAKRMNQQNEGVSLGQINQWTPQPIKGDKMWLGLNLVALVPVGEVGPGSATWSQQGPLPESPSQHPTSHIQARRMVTGIHTPPHNHEGEGRRFRQQIALKTQIALQIPSIMGLGSKTHLGPGLLETVPRRMKGPPYGVAGGGIAVLK